MCVQRVGVAACSRRQNSTLRPQVQRHFGTLTATTYTMATSDAASAAGQHHQAPQLTPDGVGIESCNADAAAIAAASDCTSTPVASKTAPPPPKRRRTESSDAGATDGDGVCFSKRGNDGGMTTDSAAAAAATTIRDDARPKPRGRKKKNKGCKGGVAGQGGGDAQRAPPALDDGGED